MESMVNLEKEFQNLYVQKNKRVQLKSIVKYFATIQEKFFTSKSINRKLPTIAATNQRRNNLEEPDLNDESVDLNNSSFYNEWAIRTCL